MFQWQNDSCSNLTLEDLWLFNFILMLINERYLWILDGRSKKKRHVETFLLMLLKGVMALFLVAILCNEQLFNQLKT